MPKIVDKIEKRKNIAKSTCNLFIQDGFVNISISQIAKVAGIGKGTIYEYFKNKEDILFELMSCLQEDYDPKLEYNLQQTTSVKQKIIFLFNLFLDDIETIKIQRKIYREFLAIYLNNPSDDIIEYHKVLKEKYSVVLTKIIEESIKKDEILEISLKFIPSIFATVEGFFIVNENCKDKILDYIENLFILLNKKEGKS
ncbi:MAG: TetR/AcrR family transcriptional regulator [Campylobacterota bacterium]|nr:TetR/AcrR family transcriptional regulator [Campylobacterota bacterium]